MSCLELLSFFSWKTQKNREHFMPKLRMAYLSVLIGLSWIYMFCFFLLLCNFVLTPDIFLFQFFFFFFWVHQTYVKFGSRVPFILVAFICLFLELSACVFFISSIKTVLFTYKIFRIIFTHFIHDYLFHQFLHDFFSFWKIKNID
jgi:hypothetical protein